MKSQDILLLLKMVSLESSEPEQKRWLASSRIKYPDDWRGWASRHSDAEAGPETPKDVYSVRNLEISTGVSKSEISASLRRCHDVGLIRSDRKSGVPRVNTKALYEFICFGIRFVFPARIGHLVQGIPTATFAPVLSEKILTSDAHPLVWEDVEGSAFGQKVDPLHKAVPYAVRKDPILYALLALTDSIRLGHERESAIARKQLSRYLGRTTDE